MEIKVHAGFALGTVQGTFENWWFETRNFSVDFRVLFSLLMESVIWWNSWMVQCSNRNWILPWTRQWAELWLWGQLLTKDFIAITIEKNYLRGSTRSNKNETRILCKPTRHGLFPDDTMICFQPALRSNTEPALEVQILEPSF